MKSVLSIFKESSRAFEGQEKEEEVVLLLRQHPFVILIPFIIYVLVGLVPIVVFFAFHTYIADSIFFLLFLFLSSLFYLILWLLMFYTLTMYTLNTVILTDKRLIDRDQHGFFDRSVSELHIYRVQDVAIYTKGAIKTFLHYGDVIVQTAASEERFKFHNVPAPEEVKNTIMRVVASRQSGVKATTKSF